MRLRVLGVLVLLLVVGLPLWADSFEVNNGGGNWSNLATWTQNGGAATRYPGQLTGTIDTVSGTVASFYTVTVDVALAEVVTLTTDCPSNTSTCAVDVPAGGLLKLTGTSAIGTDARLKLTGGTINNAGTLNIVATADFDITAGTLTGAGTTEVAFHLTTPGQVSISGGTLDGHTVNLYGKAIQSGDWAIDNGGQFHIQTNAIYDLTAGTTNTNNAATSMVINDGTLTKTGSGDSHFYAQLNNNNLVDIQQGGIVIGGDPAHNNATFQLASGTGLELEGVFNGTSNITGTGTVSIVNTPTVASGGILNMVDVSMNGGWLQGPASGSAVANISGVVTFNGGVWQTNLTVNMLTGSTINHPGASDIFINNAAVSIQSGAVMNLNPGAGKLGIDSGGSITNNGTINLLGDVTITSDLFGSPTITNGNAFNKSSGTGAAYVNCVFKNSGNVSVTSGVLKLTGGGVHTGNWSVTTGNGLAFDGGVHQLTGGSFSGTGTVGLIAGTLDVDANFLLPSTLAFQQSGGVLTGAGLWNLQGNLLWTGGTMDNSSGGGQTITQGPASQISGTTTIVKLDGRTLSNTGTLTYNPTSSLELSIDNGGQLLNSGTFNVVGDTVINANGLPVGTFTNNGTINKSTGTGSFILFPYFTNTTLNLTSGSILIKGGGQNLGTVSFGPSGTNRVIIEDCVFGITATPTFNNSGIVEVTGSIANLTLLANMAVDKLELRAGAQISGSGTLTVNVSMLWENGSMVGPGTTTIASTAVVDATTPTGTILLDNRTLTNNGTFNWNGTSQNFDIVNGATFNNNNLFDAQGNGTAGSASGFIVNAGTFKKSGGTSGTHVGSPITNSGTISSQVSGQSLIIAAGGSQTGGGMLSTAAGALIDFFGGTYSVPAGTSPFLGSGIFRVNGGTLAITGNTSVPSPAILVVESGALDVATSITFQVFYLFQWTGGTLQGNGTTRVFGGFIDNVAPTTLANNHTLTVPASSFNYDADTVNYLSINDTANLNVENGGSFYLTGACILGGTSADGVTVSGSFIKTGSGTAHLDVPLTMTSGTSPFFGATGGFLQFDAGGSSNVAATLETALSATVEFSGGTFTLGTGTTVSGTGYIVLSNATLNVNGNLTFPNFTMSGGTLGGSGALTVNAGSWTGGTMSDTGTTTLAGAFTIDGGTPKFLGRDLFTNSGVAVTMNTGFDFTGAATLTNGVGATWDDYTWNGGMGCSGCTGRFHNLGAYVKHALPTSHTVRFDNDGTAGISTSIGVTVTFGGGGTHSGDFNTTATSAGMYFSGGHTFTSTSDMTGDLNLGFSGGAILHQGTIALSGTGTQISVYAGATVTLNTAAPVTAPRFHTLGDVDGTADITVSASFALLGGILGGTGAVTIEPTAYVDLAGGTIDGRVITNNGAAILRGNILAGPTPGAALNNLGTFGPDPGTWTFAPAFNNSGTATFDTNENVTFNGGYTQLAGSTVLATGSISSPFTINIDGGSVTGIGTINADVSSDGTFAPGTSPGTIVVNGNYTMSPTAVINAEIGGTTAGVTYDRLTVNGVATLDGTINVSLINAFVPADGNTFDLLKWTSNTGTFATVNLPAFAAGTLTEEYHPTVFRIVADVVGDVGVSKTGPANAPVGTNVSFTVQVTNSGPGDATSVVVSDPTPANLSFVSNSGDCSTAYPCSLGTLPANGVKTITSTYTVTGGSGTNVTNTATVSTTSTDNVSTNNSSGATVFIDYADVSVIKTGPANAAVGSTVSFTIQVTNNGPSVADNVTVSDPAVANLSFQSNSGDCTTAFPCSLGTLGAGATVTINSTYTVTGGTGSNVTNTATVSTTSSDNVSTNNSSSATIFIDYADLAITKIGPANAGVGSTASFTIQVKNVGPSDATGVVVSDPAVANLSFNANSGDCTTAFPCALGTLTAGQTKTITASYDVTGGSGTNVTNTAAVSSASADNNNANDSAGATVFIDYADLAVTKTGPASAAVGSNVSFTITVKNVGASDASSVTVADPTPANMTFVSTSGDCTTGFPCALGTITSGQTRTITATYTITGGAGTSLTNTATASTTSSDNVGSNDSASAAVFVDAVDLGITKTGPASANVGSSVSFTITVKNFGPSQADNVVLADPTPANMTFVSTSGACAGPFPCNLGSLTAGQSKSVTATYTVTGGAGGNITNTASVSTSSSESATNNNSASATVFIDLSDLSITKTGPTRADAGSDITFTITVINGGASDAQNVVVNDPTPAGLNFLSNSGDCTTAFPCSLGTMTPGETKVINATYSVSLGNEGGDTITNTATVTTSTSDDASNNTASATVTIRCLNTIPENLSPTGTANGSGTLSWNGTGESYIVYLGKAGTGCNTQFATTSSTSVSYSGLAPGTYEWRVESLSGSCRAFSSACVTFTVADSCIVPGTPIASVVGQTTSAKTYELLWEAVAGATSYLVEEATNPEFTGALRIPETGLSHAFKHDVTEPAAFYYRVFALASCTPTAGPPSQTVRVVIVPLPPKEQKNPTATVPVGSEELIVQQVFIPGEQGQNLFFTATTDRPWLTVRPEQGVLPPAGITLDVVADPKHLPNGTFTASVIVTITTNSGKVGTAGTTTVTTPISVNLVTPVTPVSSKPSTSQYALIIPSAGHLGGIDSQWQSDIRITNAGFRSARYQLTFTPSGGTALGVKTTTITVDAGATTALDDIVKNWFGLGNLGDGVNGMLEILPLDDPANTSQTTVASSRTYNVTGNGTLGQYIPAVPFPSFIGRALPNALPQVLSLQQIAQNAAYRTNVGLANAGSAPVEATLSVFNASGTKLTDIPVSLAAGEQRQMNQVLATHGIELADGRIEVKVNGGDGKVTAYASVVDSGTQDPLLVSGQQLGGIGSSKFVLAGVANLDNALAHWRTDMRVFNYGTASQAATLTFFPFNNGVSRTAQVLLGAGQVMSFDNVLRTQFGVENEGGVVHLTTANNAPLVVTGRTYNQTDNGTFGQYIPAVTAEQAVGLGGRTLHILQVEDSTRYRTNIGVAEVSGKPAMVELQVVLPDSKTTPTVQIPLSGNEFRQFNVIRELGVGNVYNARITVRVISGEGRVTAYGSVIDELTQDPTYVPAQ